ncbi:EAL and HDOD domain-containing protein [Pengzhenrongella frigida]|uniref:HDOD domain-containing protein n=1 Tax=Pengzhenrongella frigida TaxID=1259133 RepID=A0A4Q5N0R0_9MICO|nr:HDOD domain-containing protein [Cellulomonas sp. HLT2-17]RYV51658.1 HDOD domain-containing protein [Cellulomonas sp. HLT2-17]
MTLLAGGLTVHRQHVVRPDRSVLGYAVNIVVGRTAGAGGEDRLDALVDERYATLDLAALAGGHLIFVCATPSMLRGEWPRADLPAGVVMEVPARFAELPEAAEHLGRLRAAGLGLALADYAPGPGPDALLSLVDFVKVDLGRGDVSSADAVAAARTAGVPVIAERVDTEAAVKFCVQHRIDLLQGPLFRRDATPTAHAFTAGELQCLELAGLLRADEVDHARVIRVIASDPELSMRALRLVNSGAVGPRRRIDSIRRAVVMLGPQPLTALAITSLLGARAHPPGVWFMLSRGTACRSLVGIDAAYTVGLLSAAAAQLQVAPADLVAHTGVSDDVGDALVSLSGPYGPVLAAVLAHEENDVAGVEATGFAPGDVARAYLDALADAHATAAALVG